MQFTETISSPYKKKSFAGKLRLIKYSSPKAPQKKRSKKKVILRKVQKIMYDDMISMTDCPLSNLELVHITKKKTSA